MRGQLFSHLSPGSIAALAVVAFLLANAAQGAAGEANIGDAAWTRTRRLAAIFGVPTEGLPVIATRDWSETAALGLPPLSEAHQQELDRLLDRYVGEMTYGFFDEADRLAADLQERFPNRYGFEDFLETRRPGETCRAAEPVYAFWPAYYRKLYRAIAEQLGAECRPFAWPPRIAESDGGSRFFLQVNAVGRATVSTFPAGAAGNHEETLADRGRTTTTCFLVFDERARRIDRLTSIPGSLEHVPCGAPPRLWAGRDLDGDGSEEFLVTTYGKPYGVAGDEGEFLLLDGKGLRFRRRVGLAPRLAFLEDVTGDGLPEAIVEFPSCGAHTCGADFVVVGAHGGAIRNLSGEDSTGRIEISNHHDVHLSGSRPPELVFSGGSIGSAGAGVHRERTETWGWNGTRFVLKDTVWEKTPWRHHAVYDGDFAFRKGALEAAAAAYERAVDDADLKDDQGWGGDSRASCRQYSAFRLVLIHLAAGRGQEALGWRQWLGANYPDAPLTRAAEVLFDRWQATGDAVAACDAVTALLGREQRPVGTLENMGYGNPAVTAAEVCPLR